jgi:hypothetical protein
MGVRNCSTFLGLLLSKFSISCTVSLVRVSKRSHLGRYCLIKPSFPEEVAKVVRWYSMTQRERNLIEDEMRPSLLRSTELSDEEVEEAREFLNAAAKLPKVIMTA